MWARRLDPSSWVSLLGLVVLAVVTLLPFQQNEASSTQVAAVSNGNGTEISDDDVDYAEAVAVAAGDDIIIESNYTEEAVDELLSAAMSRASRFEANGCTNGTTCILKCCPDDMFVQRTPSSSENPSGSTYYRCVPGNQDELAADDDGAEDSLLWKPIFHRGESMLDIVNVTHDFYEILDDFLPVCNRSTAADGVGLSGFFPQMPDLKPEQTTHLLTTGEVYSVQYNLKFSGPEYCVDHLKIGNQTTNLTLLCFPARAEQGELDNIMMSNDPTIMSVSRSYVKSMGLTMSMVFLGITFALTFLAPEPNLLLTLTLRAFLGTVFAASGFLTYLQLVLLHSHVWPPPSPGLCTPVALLTQHTLVAAFLWKNVIGFDIWRTRKNVPMIGIGVQQRFLKRCAYAFGIPLVVTVPAMIFQLLPWIPDSVTIAAPIDSSRTCWFRDDDWILGIYVYGPISVAFIFNFLFLGLIGRHLLLESRRAHNLYRHQSTVRRFVLFGGFVLTLGMGWTTEMIEWTIGYPYVWFVTDAFQYLTGPTAFILYMLPRTTRDDLRSKARSWIRCIVRPCPCHHRHAEGNFEIEHVDATTAREAEGQINVQMAEMSTSYSTTADEGAESNREKKTLPVLMSSSSQGTVEEHLEDRPAAAAAAGDPSTDVVNI